MSPEAIQVVTWVAALLVVGLYVLFIVWRYRVDRRKKAAEDKEASALSQAIAKAAAAQSTPPPTAAAPVIPDVVTKAPDPVSASPAVPTPAPTPAPATPSPAPAATVTTVAGALTGITLPSDLAPLTSMAPRPNTGDRVAFWTDTAPAEVVGRAFADELERLGYAITPLNEQTLEAQRDTTRVFVVIHPDGRAATIGVSPAFTSVPEHSVVIEVWIPE